jgi:predicted benzoate:H+ symporter BenE
MVLATEARREGAARRTEHHKTRQRWYIAAMLSVLLAVVLGGCGSSVSQASFVMKDSGSASLLQWTETGHTVSGSLALATLDNANLDTKNLAFAGTISGSSVTLTFPQGFGT